MSLGQSAAMHSNVLALNRLYLAIHVISVKRAFCLLWKNMAEVISIENGVYMSYDFESWRGVSDLKIALDEDLDTEDWIQAVNIRIQVPRVIRLIDYDRVPRAVVKFSRRNVFFRDGHCCQYCGRKFGTHNLSLDHVLPRSRGGETSWENIVSACLKCNVRKGGRTPKEAGMKLSQRPVRPKRNPLFAHQLSSEKYASWKNFIR
jgi:5-methylcytosine-specific restriction endonuclease McrA